MNPLIASAPASVPVEEEYEPGVSAALPLVLLAACLWLGWLVYKQVTFPPVPPSHAAVLGAIEPLPDLPESKPFVMPPADEFANVVDRPLFSPSRRQPTEVVPVVPVIKEPLNLLLTGVITSEGKRTAILRPKAEAPEEPAAGNRNRRRAKQQSPAAADMKSIQLSEGGTYKDWKLEQIELDSALFVRGEEETWLEISFDLAAPAQPRPDNQTRERGNTQQAPGDEDRDATPKERRLIMDVLRKEGCQQAEDMELEDGMFLVEEVECDDGRTYEITLDRNFKIIEKELDD